MNVLESLKDGVNVAEDDTAFDKEILRYANSVLIIAKQLGLVSNITRITNNTIWSDICDDETLEGIVEDYICSKVKLRFDPPLASTALESLKQNVAELEWRMNAEAENMG